MRQVDRGLFVPPGPWVHAYQDSPQTIGFNATISAPHMHAQCLELLENHLQVNFEICLAGEVHVQHTCHRSLHLFLFSHIPPNLSPNPSLTTPSIPSLCGCFLSVAAHPTPLLLQQPGMRALDVGSGTGYLTACFGLLLAPTGKAVGVEHIPELVERSKRDVARSAAGHLLESGVIALHAGDGRQGWPHDSPYDAIHVGAAAPEIPLALKQQLKEGGRMVIPVGTWSQDLLVVDKLPDGRFKESHVASVRYVPLTSKDEQLEGY
ncbi:unnamed protein product [Closterium sp. Naga37s-1]|nr:unnamed protein product [Closterium sp. Naga37s-1]